MGPRVKPLSLSTCAGLFFGAWKVDEEAHKVEEWSLSAGNCDWLRGRRFPAGVREEEQEEGGRRRRKNSSEPG